MKDFWRRPGESFEKRSGDHIDLINGTDLTATVFLGILEHEAFSVITRGSSSAIRSANRVADMIADILPNRSESSNSESDEEHSWVRSPYAESKSILFWELE